MIVSDFQQLYGLDLGDPELVNNRSWPWFLDRYHGLFTVRSRTSWAWLGPGGQGTVREILARGGDVDPWL